MIYLFDKDLQVTNSISKDDVIECTQDLELGGIITASATIKYSQSYESAFYFGVKEDNNFWIFKIRNIQKHDDALTLDGIYIFFDDLKGKVLRDIRNQKYPLGAVMDKILADTSWKVGINVANSTGSKNFYYQSCLDAFYEACKIWDFEFKFNIVFKDGKILEKRIDLYDRISKDFGRWYEYGDKLYEVMAESSTDELFTAFIGRGKGIPLEDENGNPTGGFSRKITFEDVEFKKDGYYKPKGQDYIEIKEATRLYGYPDGTPRMCVVDFDNIDDENELALATYEFALVNSRPKLQLKATAKQDENVELGETVAIIRSDMNIRYKVRVFKIKKDLKTKKVASYEFGDKIIQSAGSRLKAEAYEKKERKEQIDSYIDALRDEINSSYFNDSAYNYDLKIGNKHELPAGYYSFDRPIDQNPTKVIYMGAGKMLIADSKNPDGSWHWTTMATGGGVAAESIVGTLGEFARVNAGQINVNNDFTNTALGKVIDDGLKVVNGKIVDETGKIREDLALVDGKIVDLNSKAVLKDTLYNNVKITPQKGIQVFDNKSRERVQLGNYATGRYGLKLVDETGQRTVLDDVGILQSWQDSQTDNVDRGYPLNLRIYIPNETSRIYAAKLQIYTENFRAYQRGNKYGGYDTKTSEGGGGDYVSESTTADGSYSDSLTSGAVEVTYLGKGNHDHALRDGELKDMYGNYMGKFRASGEHKHEVSIRIPSHQHSVRFTLPDHTHRYEIPSHTHDPIFGIITQYSNSAYSIQINGTDVTRPLTGKNTFSGTVENVDISRYLSIGRWNTIAISNTGLGRVSASIFMQAFIKYGGA